MASSPRLTTNPWTSPNHGGLSLQYQVKLLYITMTQNPMPHPLDDHRDRTFKEAIAVFLYELQTAREWDIDCFRGLSCFGLLRIIPNWIALPQIKDRFCVTKQTKKQKKKPQFILFSEAPSPSVYYHTTIFTCRLPLYHCFIAAKSIVFRHIESINGA